MTICKVKICDRTTDGGGRGWCKAHYMRWFQTGDARDSIPLRMHNVDPQLRFWPKVNKDGPLPVQRPELGPCWIYTGNRQRDGYGLFRVGKKHVLAHKFSYDTLVGDIPVGLELDHLCRDRSCVRPTHLEATTHAENMRRAWPERTHCNYDHEYTEENTLRAKNGSQRCRECARRRVREHSERKRLMK